MNTVISLAEQGWVPDRAIRYGIRRLLANRRLREGSGGDDERRARRHAVIDQLRCSPVAVAVDKANEQHYEAPPEFFQRVLGPRLKYSCCLWDSASDLAAAEEAMLELTCQRADLADGQQILELGCGWGSLTLWMAERFPRARITAVSNSHRQRAFIVEQCRQRGLTNVEAHTCDINRFEPAGAFDRIVSVEMFEHVRNYEQLLARIAGWLRSDGRLFVHIFCHRETPYLFEIDGRHDWMARHFFTGGVMPSFDLLGEFQRDLRLSQTWRVGGEHYARTCDEWLARQDAHRRPLIEVLRREGNVGQAELQFRRWRMFFMACAELFRYGGGEEWFVGHYLFDKR